MKTLLRSFPLYILISLSIFACNNAEKKHTTTEEPIPPVNTPNSLAYFIQQTQTVESGTEIPLELCQRFIQPALANKPLHPYIESEKATYSYGQILHEDSEMVAFTFYYKAAQDRNLMAASFMASFNAVTQEFIDCKMVFGSSTFDFQNTKGYNLGFSCKSDLEFIESEQLVLILKSQIKYFYTAFKEGVDPKANVAKTERYTLLKNGQFLFG